MYRDEESGASKCLPFLDIDRYPNLLARGNLGDLVINEEILNEIKIVSTFYWKNNDLEFGWSFTRLFREYSTSYT